MMFSVVILFENTFEEIIFPKRHTKCHETNLKQIKIEQNIFNNESYTIENFKNIDNTIIFPIILTQYEIKTYTKGNNNKK